MQRKSKKKKKKKERKNQNVAGTPGRQMGRMKDSSILGRVLTKGP